MKKIIDNVCVLVIASSFIVVTTVMVDNQLTDEMRSVNLAGEIIPITSSPPPQPTGNSPGLPKYPQMNPMDKIMLLLVG